MKKKLLITTLFCSCFFQNIQSNLLTLLDPYFISILSLTVPYYETPESRAGALLELIREANLNNFNVQEKLYKINPRTKTMEVCVILNFALDPKNKDLFKARTEEEARLRTYFFKQYKCQ